MSFSVVVSAVVDVFVVECELVSEADEVVLGRRVVVNTVDGFVIFDVAVVVSKAW